ncbi:MAG: nitronate monooxygenase, partial [Lachnospiraceae bacterium]|nr:nitronate monooxygenase [Lachnospiraceae bacterium]
MEKKAIKPLKIGPYTAKYPIIQGGMGVGISLSSLAGAVAKAGGVGIISTAQIGFRDPGFTKNPMDANLKAIHEEFAKARAIAPEGVLGFNIMVATNGYKQYVKEAVKAGANVIISGAGLPVDLPKFVAEAEEELLAEGRKKQRTMIAPIVSSVKSAMVICRMWDRKHKTAPDFVVIEGPCAGGHLGFSEEQLTEFGADTESVSKTYKQSKYEEEIRSIINTVKEFADKYKKEIPVTRCFRCLAHCNPAETPYCITKALINAA